MINIFKRFIFNFRLYTGIVFLSASTTVIAEADTIYLKNDCGNQTECYTTVDTMLNAIWSRATLPSASNPLLVNIGSGVFEAGTTFCDGTTEPKGHISFKGSGKNNTFFIKNSNRGHVMKIVNCDGLNFQDFTIDGRMLNDGVIWEEGGDSTWTNIDIINAARYGWFDSCDSTGEDSEHYWFSSKIIGTGKIDGDGYRFTYRTRCAISWFYGGDLVAIDDGINLGTTAIAIFADGGDIRLFGSSVRSIRTANSVGASDGGSLTSHTAIVVANSGKVHMHGGIINVAALNDTYDSSPAAISVFGNSSVHTPGTAFSITPTGNGIAKRIIGGNETSVMSPFQWPASSSPPSLSSMSGSDTFIETDCSSTGACNGEGSETHMMIYNSSCNVDGPWFDSTTGRCRGQL